MAKNVALMELETNPNIGIYMFANDKFCLIGKDINEKKKKEIENVLEVPVHKVSILNTDLVGIFVCGNNDFILVPEIFENEKEELEKICKKYEVKLIEFKERLNTFGNNICIGDKEVLISSEYGDKFEKTLKKETNINTVKIVSENFKAIGSVCKFLNNKYFVSQEFTEDELKKILKKISGIGTVNSGSHYISSGVVGNCNGVLIGSMSSTVEIQNIVEGLGYLDE